MAFLGEEEHIRTLQERFRGIYFIITAAFLLLLTRLIYLQIFKGDELRKLSEENRIKRVEIPAPRGIILDRNHTPLVDNRPSFDLEMIPQYLNESKKKKVVIQKVSQILRISKKRIYKKLRRARHAPPFEPVKIKTHLNREEVAKIETWKIDLPGVQVKMEIQRTSLFRDISAHLIGYIGKITKKELKHFQKQGLPYDLTDRVGKMGVEKQFENILHGKKGMKIIEVDALGRRVRKSKSQKVLKPKALIPAKPGNRIVLTIDQDLQNIAAKAFQKHSGALVAIDPRNGEVLAMISRPSFNPTEFSRGISTVLWRKLLQNKDHPFRNKAISDPYPPGSVFKIITAIAGLEEGVINEHTKLFCPGFIRIGNRIFHCHKKHGHGWLNVVDAIAQSCNVFFYQVAKKLGSVDKISKWAKALGLGSRTNILLNHETSGLIPTKAWKKKMFHLPWTAGETVSVAIGQSYVLTSILQLARTFSAIANGGTLFQPKYILQIETVYGKRIQTLPVKKTSTIKLKPKTLELIEEGLWKVVNDPKGTAHYQNIPGINFAGKTGSAQVIRLQKEKIFQKCTKLPLSLRQHGLFVGIAPIEHPAIVVAAISEHSCHGSIGAAPIVRKVIDAYLKKNYPELFLSRKKTFRRTSSKPF